MSILVRHLLEVVIFAFLLLAALSVGALLLRWLRLHPIRLLESLVLALGLGLFLLAYGVFVLGLLGLLYRGLAIAWVAVCFAGGVMHLRALVGEKLASMRQTKERQRKSRLIQAKLSGTDPFTPPTQASDVTVDYISTSPCWLEWLLVAAGIPIVLFCFVAALTPPTIWEWDSLSYHLAVPKMYIKAHRIHYIPFLDHSNFPFTVEMLYTLGLLMMNFAVAKLFHWLFFLGCLGLILVFPISTEVKQSRGEIHRPTLSVAGVAGALAFLSVPVLVTQAGWAYIELGLCFYALMTFFGLSRWIATGERGWLLLTGIGAGVCLGIKYTGILVFAFSACIALATLWMRKSLRSQRSQTGAFIGSIFLALLIGSPWYVKNFVYTGNPLYPFFYEIFGGRNWNQQMADQYRKHQLEFGTQRTFLNFILTPWNLTMRSSLPLEQGGIKYEVAPSPCVNPGLALLALVPTLLLIFGKPFYLRLLLGVGAAWLVVWFFTVQYLRYLAPCLAIFCVCAGGAYAYWLRRSWLTAIAARLTLTLALAYSFVIMFKTTSFLVQVVIGWIKEEEFLSMTLPAYDAALFVNRYTPPTAKVITFGEPLGFYFDRDYLWGDPGHHLLINYSRLQTWKDLLVALQRLGITHILVNQRYFRLRKDASPLQRCVVESEEQGFLKRLFDSKGEVLFEVDWKRWEKKHGQEHPNP